MATSTTTPAPELKTYNGNCHCGAFSFTVSIPELTGVMTCNCSICFKKGYRWIFPGEGLTITKGEGTLKEYVFGKKTMKHCFCGTCGTGIMGLRDGGIGVNANTLDLSVDLFALPAMTYDGAAAKPAYVPRTFSGAEPSANIEGAKTYYGGCHCGAVTVAMKTPGPLTEGKQRILECDCSICTRNGTTLTYPPASAFSVHDPTSVLSSYSFGREFNEHMFCSVCGVNVHLHKKEKIPEEKWKKYKNEKSQEAWRETCTVNLKCFEGVEWEVLKEKALIERIYWKDVEPLYVCPE